MSSLDRLHFSEPATDSSGKRWKEGWYSDTGDAGRFGRLQDELTDAAVAAGGEVLKTELVVHEGRHAIQFRCRVPVNDNGK
jgi:hypothetical protein